MKRPRFPLFALLFVLFSWAGAATPESFVIDENRLMSAQQVEYFNRISLELHQKTGSAIALALLDDIGGRDAREYALALAEKRGLDCKAGKDIQILVALKQRRQVVLVGQASSALVPLSESLQQNTLVPEFRKEHYGDGLLAFAYGLAEAQARENGATLEILPPPKNDDTPMTLRGWLFIVAVFALLLVFGGKARRFGFVDNMKKLLSVSEIEKSNWPETFRNTFGENLVSAFLHGKCLMEGFDALDSPWTVSFILKDNSPEEIAKLRAHEKRAQRENLQFARFYSPAEIVSTLDTRPLEYLHIAHRNAPLCGIKPLDGFIPHEDALRRECAEKLREIANLDCPRGDARKFDGPDCPQTIASERPRGDARELSAGERKKVYAEALPVLYGVYYLESGRYPESHSQVIEAFPGIEGNDICAYLALLADKLAPRK